MCPRRPSDEFQGRNTRLMQGAGGIRRTGHGHLIGRRSRLQHALGRRNATTPADSVGCLTAVQNRLSAVHPSSIARDQRADHTTLDRQVVVAGEEVRRRVAHDRPRLRIRSNGLAQAAQSHWDVMTVGPTSPTRSTSSEPHHGQITRSEAWAPWGTRRRRRPRHRGRVWAAGCRSARREARTMRPPTARKAWSNGHNQSRTSNGQPATEAVR